MVVIGDADFALNGSGQQAQQENEDNVNLMVNYINSVKQLDGRTIADVQDGNVTKHYRLTIERQNLDAVVLDVGMAGSVF